MVEDKVIKMMAILWEQTAYEGTVLDDRHRKNTYASGTPVTDGKLIYAFFEAEGLYCYDFAGKLIWKTPIAKIASVGMGPSTSPVLADGVVVLQCDEDEGKNSFIAGVDKKTGKELWNSGDAIASWNHWSGLSVANGKVYLSTFDGYQYCFGLSGGGAQTATKGGQQ